MRSVLSTRNSRVSVGAKVGGCDQVGSCDAVGEGVGIAVINPLTALDFVSSGLVLRRLTHTLPFITALVRPAQTGKAPLADAFATTLATRRDADLATAKGLCAAGA